MIEILLSKEEYKKWKPCIDRQVKMRKMWIAEIRAIYEDAVRQMIELMDKSKKMEKIEEENNPYAYTDFQYDTNIRKWYVILDGSFDEEDLIKILDTLQNPND